MDVQFLYSAELPRPATHQPHATRAGDFIFTSSIYPLDTESGLVVQADETYQYVRESHAEAQSRRCLETLRKTLEGTGSSLSNVLRVEVHLARPEDFLDFKLVWQEYFPSEPPALTATEVGDEHIYPGALLNLHAVALANDSSYRREVIRADDAPSLSDAMGASQAVRAGPFVFPSAVPATDFVSGIAAGRRPGFPNYGSDAEMQAQYHFQQLNRVLAKAGTSLEQAVEAQLYEPDLSTFHDVDGIWGQSLPTPPPRSSMGMKGLLVPGALMVANLIVLVPDAEHQKTESRAGIHYHPVDVRKVNFSPTIKAGPWRFLAGQVATPDMMSVHNAPPGLPYYFSDIEVQTRFTMGRLREQLEANDSDLAHVFDARVFLLYPRRDYRGFERAWRTFFPNPDRSPALALIPSTGIMFPGPIIEIDLSAVAR
ncbi:MAG: RidA family protein [Chloroflexi bacterium]|nr:RidA family protein [Chloroflexota bacterium]